MLWFHCLSFFIFRTEYIRTPPGPSNRVFFYFDSILSPFYPRLPTEKLFSTQCQFCQGIDSGNLCSLAGRYEKPFPTRLLAPIDCSKIPALSPNLKTLKEPGSLCGLAGRYDNPIPTRFLSPTGSKIPAQFVSLWSIEFFFVHRFSEMKIKDQKVICHGNFHICA